MGRATLILVTMGGIRIRGGRVGKSAFYDVMVSIRQGADDQENIPKWKSQRGRQRMR